MTPQRYEQLAEVFAATCELSPPRRAEILDDACHGDARFRAEAEALLAHDDEAGSFLEESFFALSSAFDLGTRRFELDAIFEPGDRFGQYRIRRVLGTGGQGTVYLAEDTRLGRRVALKVLSFGGRIHPRFLARFKREARAAGRLGHPGICTVHTADVEDGLPYIAMQYVDGETLAERIAIARTRTGQRAPAYAVETIEKVARAVHAAHEAGVVHRDLKPGNIMITPAGEPVVLDFGLATDEQSLATLTMVGDRFGTPAYMAPEQIESQLGFADRRTDVYALGVTLYECLTLCRPFEAQSREALYREVLSGDYEDPRRRRAGISKELGIVLATAMAKEQDRRYQTAIDLAEDLRRVREWKPARVRPAGPMRRLAGWSRRDRKLAITAAAIFLVLTVGLAVTGTLLHGTNISLAENRRLTDLRTLEHLEQVASTELWPVLPGTVPAMNRWLEEAVTFSQRLSVHEAYLASLQSRGRPDDTDRGWVFDDPALAYEHDLVEAFVRDLTAFPATIQQVRTRRHEAAAMNADTIVAYHDTWQRTIEAIAAHPSYGGLRIEPQVGLVPIGLDPDSGLFEFAHPRTGEIPQRNPQDGRIRPTDAMTLVFVLIPGGSFKMGADLPDLEQEYYVGIDGNRHRKFQSNELPVHRVELDPFFVSKYEMTQGQWIRIAGFNPSHASPETRSATGLRFTLLHPVENLSWSECMEIIGRYGLTLPTEAQWEYAARAGTRTIWWTGNDMDSLRGAVNLADQSAARVFPNWEPVQIWPDLDDGWPWTAPIGRFRANPFGLHDVHGNVWEMVQDGLHSYEYPVRSGDGLRLPPADAPPPSMPHLSRGGACELDAWNARAARRYGGRKFFACGFRPVRPLDGRWRIGSDP